MKIQSPLISCKVKMVKIMISIKVIGIIAKNGNINVISLNSIIYRILIIKLNKKKKK